MAETDLIVIGVIAGAHGVRGEAKVKAFGDPARLCDYGPFLDAHGQTIATPARARPGGAGAVVVAFKEALTREQVEALRGALLHAPRSALSENLDEDEFYHADLIGLAVEDVEGRPLGAVRAIFDFGAGDMLEISGPEETILLPFTRSAVPHVDIAGGRIVADPPEAIEARPPEQQPKSQREAGE